MVGCREPTATVAYLHSLIRNWSGYSVQSTRGKVWHSCAFCSRWESLLLDFHSWKKNISWCPQVLHDVEEEWDKEEPFPWLVWVGSPGRSSLLPSECPVGCPGYQEGGTHDRHAEPYPDMGHLCSAEHPPLYFSHHPYSLPYRLIFVLMATELTETSSQGNKEKQGTWPRGGLCHMSLSYAVSWPVCWDNLWMMPTLCSSQQNSLLFLFKSFCNVFPNNFIGSRVWCLLFLASQ